MNEDLLQLGLDILGSWAIGYALGLLMLFYRKLTDAL